MEKEDLNQSLKITNENLEEAIQLLDNLSLTNPDLPAYYAKALVNSFENATKEQAVQIAINAFNQFLQETQKIKVRNDRNPIDPINEIERLKSGIEKLVQDNTALKRAVVKLKERADASDNIERENTLLKQEIHQLSLSNYMLKAHLQNALESKKDIEQEKDVF
jgi:predicted RNase H-like nuclease (RuvC/YqgF family)